MSDPIYQDATMAQVRAVDGTYISYPFLDDGDTQTKVYNMVCTQLATDYNAAQVALDTPMSSAAAAGVIALPFPADSTAYFVGDTGHTPAGGGMISFTRTFANIPQPITVPSGSQFVTFPGYTESGITIDDVYTEVGVTGIFITTSSAHGLSVEEPAYLRRVQFTGTGISEKFAFPPISDYENEDFYPYAVLEVVDTTTFRIDPQDTGYNAPTPGADLTIVSGDFQKSSVNGNIISITANPLGAGLMLTTDTPHLAGQGEQLAINLQYKLGTSDETYSVNGFYELVSVPSSTTFTIDVGKTFTAGQIITLQTGATFDYVGKSRSSVSFNVNTDTSYDYILPGVTQGYATASDVNIPQSFNVYKNSGGEITDTCADNSVTEFPNLILIQFKTIPTATQYTRMVSNGANIVIESSLSEWAGNILVLKTKTCKAR
jgi:hypothetical protein